MKGGKNWENKRELVGFVSMLAKHLYMSEEGEGKLNFLKWCKENEKLYFHRYSIEPNILFEMLGLLLKKITNMMFVNFLFLSVLYYHFDDIMPMNIMHS